MEKLLEKFMNKKTVENLIVFLILIIITIIALNSMYKDEEEFTQTSNTMIIDSQNKTGYKTEFEIRLENVLSKINGVGDVDVMVTHENDVKKIPMTDTKNITTITSEKDTAGGERKTEEINSETTIVYETNGNNKIPVIQEYTIPQIAGVIVVAEGGDDAFVKEKLISAVETVTGISIHKIQVFGK